MTSLEIAARSDWTPETQPVALGDADRILLESTGDRRSLTWATILKDEG